MTDRATARTAEAEEAERLSLLSTADKTTGSINDPHRIHRRIRQRRVMRSLLALIVEAGRGYDRVVLAGVSPFNSDASAGGGGSVPG